MSEPTNVVVLGGPNGAGKTTLATILLAEVLGIGEFINADISAAERSPDDPEAVAMAVGRILIERIRDLAARGESFAFETTMASRSFAPMLRQLAADGYRVHVIYVWLREVELAVSRVADRVRRGGHTIPADVIRRRYRRGLYTFFNLYMPVAHTWRVYDNTGSRPTLVAEHSADGFGLVHESETWDTIQEEAREP